VSKLSVSIAKRASLGFIQNWKTMSDKKDSPSEEEIEEYLDGMVAKGYMESEERDGKKFYRVTLLGKAFAEAKKQKDSEDKDRN
jgi:DNA-binding PadR family transcriptional regulator